MKLGMNMSLKLKTILFLTYHQFGEIKNINESSIYLKNDAGSTVQDCNMTGESRKDGKRRGAN
jgi:hypothetical protein